MILKNGNNVLNENNRILNYTTTTYDTDALAFISAATITATTQMMAVNDLVVDLKTFGLWNKFIAIYPIVGGTANSHKYNLKDTRDLDAAYRLVFGGSVTHTSTGMVSSSSGYADTKINPASAMTLNDSHISYYSRTNGTNGTFEMGASGGGSGPFTLIQIKYSNSFFYGDVNQTTEDGVLHSLNGGYFLATRTASNIKKLVINGNVALNGTAVSTSLPNKNIYILAQNSNGTAVGFTAKECAFASIGFGLSVQDSANLYTAVQKYQGALNRQV